MDVWGGTGIEPVRCRPVGTSRSRTRAQARCVTCGNHAFIADSADYWDDAEPDEIVCPYGGQAFELAIGFALRADGEVRWISVGSRCIQDGTLGICADWKIDYAPTAHLLNDTVDLPAAP